MEVVAAEAMKALLPKLGELLKDEYNLEKHVRKGVKSLETELTMMHAALRKVAEVPRDQLDEQVRIWAGKVRELSYDMEDAIDAFMVDRERELAANPENIVKRFVKKITKVLRKGKALRPIADAIKEAQGLAEELAALELHDSSSSGASIDPRLTALYSEVTELVGIDDTRDELIRMLGAHDASMQQLKTISIVGFGGLGKTTIAKAVYKKIKEQFDCGAFVSVSRNPDITKIFKKMLYELDKVKYANIDQATWDETQLIDELREFLRDKRYFIIIDDIWDGKVWGYIKCAFSKNNLGSRLITTTRNVNVSRACCPSNDDIIYEMKPLSVDDSKRLFYKRIFSQDNECPHELEDVSKDILKKCGGVPLAIITIASLLANKEIQTKDQWYALCNSIGHGLTEGANVEDMHMILSFSYYDLPSHLKPCLLYLSIFPEDYEIRRDRLIWRWIAEGFVQHDKKGDSEFELGENYFNELINRSIIQLVEIDDAVGETEAYCRVHDMVLDLIYHLSSEENFVTVLDGLEQNTSSQRKVRRLSLQSSMTELTTPQATTSMSQVRSFTIFSPAINLMPSLSCFHVIRVLDLEGCDLGQSCHLNLGYVKFLFHLRYLGLRSTCIHKVDRYVTRDTYVVRELPTEIENLQFLQTLDLWGAGIEELPPTVVRLRHLKCLHLDYVKRLPDGFGNLTSLEELSVISTKHYADVVKELSQLTKLRVLEIHWDEMDERMARALVGCLGNLHKLQSLDIYVPGGEYANLMREGWVPPPQLRRFRSKGIGGSFSTLPTWINSLLLISSLEIWVNEVGREDIQILGTLPALRSLFLATSHSQEECAVERFVVGTGAFQCARECSFIWFVTVPSMFPQGAMPRVRFLKFFLRARDFANGDFDLRCLHMGNLPSLEHVEVSLWCKKARFAQVKKVEAALRRAADFHPNHPTISIDRMGIARHAGYTSRTRSKAMEEKECDEDTCRMNLESIISRTHDIMKLAGCSIYTNSGTNLLQETSDAVYDAEDLLTELKIKNANDLPDEPRVKTEGNMIEYTNSESCSSIEHGFFNKVKEIEQKLDHFTRQKIHMGLCDPRHQFINESIKLKTNSVPEECKMFGYGKEFSKLLQLLGVSSSSAINESQTRAENVPVLPILGRGGVGKTTLALQVFNDKNARGYFDRTIWISASNDFHEKDLIKKFILSVAECEIESDDLGCIQRVLTGSIIDQSKRFLLVVDDVQEDVCKEVSDRWRSSLAVLKHAKPGTIVLMTTRSSKVANIFGSVDPFLLEGFTKVTLWKYFKICVFGSDSFNINRALEDIGRRIVEKLNGVPLAAKILGRLLSLKPTAEYWNSILTSELWERPEEETRVCPPVLLSYQYLPFHLKRCFSYCSTYPKGYKFDKDTLVDCWQGVGLLVPHGDKVVHQDVGHMYFHQLVNRSFFQKTQSSSEYVMHDMLHDMASFVSKNECFMTRDKNDLAGVHPNIHHMSMLSSSGLDDSCLKSLCGYNKLRSLVCYGVESSIITPAVECWPHGLTKIRMLSFVSCQLKELPESIGDLRHLRYLNISACTFDKLPSSFWYLHNLEILDAQKCKFQYLPQDVTKLINLRKVKLNGDLVNQFRDIPEIGKLRFLQELPYFDVANALRRGIGELKNMNHLHGSLEISGLFNVMSKNAAAKAELHMKNYLDTLILSWDQPFRTCTRQKSSGQEMEVLEGLYPPPYLKHLEIKCYTGVEFCPSWFRKEKLRDLSSLSIYSCPNLESMSFQSSASSSNRSSIGLERLTRLSISRCRRLSSLERFLQPSYLPAIKMIHIEKCEDLVSLPVQGFAGFVHHEDLELSECWNLIWPADQVFPPSLKVLKLEACGYICESTLSCLRNLGALTTLKLQICHSVESIPAQVWSGLPSLENLAIFYCKGLKSIGGSEAIAQIENVDVRDCPNLRDLEQPFHKESIGDSIISQLIASFSSI